MQKSNFRDCKLNIVTFPLQILLLHLNTTLYFLQHRLEVLKTMHAHSQFCMSGDHTLSATVLAINELANRSENYDESFVIVLSDANFDRYGKVILL